MTATPLEWLLAPVVWLVFLAGMLLAMEGGRRLRAREPSTEQAESAAFGALQGAAFGLMGLVIAFAVSGAATRFDHRRDLVVQEANDISTAYLRIDLLPIAARLPLQDKFREYVDSRLQTYRAGTDFERINSLLQETSRHQTQIWTMTVKAIDEARNPQVAAEILSPLNAMFDIVTTRTAATQMHPPMIVWIMLGGLALVCSLLVGYDTDGKGRRFWLHLLTFAVLFSLTLYVIVDMEFPRLGLIRVDAMDRVIQDVRDSMR